MVTGDDITFLTRMRERLLGVLIGGMSVFLGYPLSLAPGNCAATTSDWPEPSSARCWSR